MYYNGYASDLSATPHSADSHSQTHLVIAAASNVYILVHRKAASVLQARSDCYYLHYWIITCQMIDETVMAATLCA